MEETKVVNNKEKPKCKRQRKKIQCQTTSSGFAF